MKKLKTRFAGCSAAALVFLVVSGPARALEVTLGQEGSMVFVWRDGDAMSDGMKLIQAGIHKTNPVLVMQLLSCAVPAGTKAIITDGGFATQTILVTDGESTGCRGDVVTEDIDRQ